MKNFKIQVSDKEVIFFMELMDKLNFVQYEAVESFNEPRVYPGADFQIRSGKNQVDSEVDTVAQKTAKSIPEEMENSKKEALNNIRNVISLIDRQRDQTK